MSNSIFTRTEILLGQAALTKLCQARILIAGIGGVGGFVAEALGRIGIQQLTLLDHDTVVASNLNRQIVALNSTVGQKKVEVMAARLRDINPDVQLTIMPDFLHKEQAEDLIKNQKFDMVVDCIDSIACKAALVAACLQNEVKIISSLGAGNRLDVTQVKVTKLNQTQGCGLARELRGLLKSLGVRTNYPVVYSQETARAPLPHQPVGAGEGRPRAVNGTISYMPALFGMMLAGVAVKELLGEDFTNS